MTTIMITMSKLYLMFHLKWHWALKFLSFFYINLILDLFFLSILYSVIEFYTLIYPPPDIFRNSVLVGETS